MVFSDRSANGLFAVSTIFFFLGFVVFEGLKIEVGGNMINPYVVTGFAFAFGGTMWRYRKAIKKFMRNI